MTTPDPQPPTGATTEEVLQQTEPEVARAVFQLLPLLLAGGPVSVERFAASTGRSHEEAETIFVRLRDWGAEFDGAGDFVGAGLTLVPTPHRYEVDGQRFFTWCAPDTLLFPLMFGHTASIASTDPVSGELVHATISPQGVERIEPATAVLTSRRGGDVADVRGSICQFGHYFTSRKTATAYVARQGSAAGEGGMPLEILTPDEAFHRTLWLIARKPLRDTRKAE